MPMTSEMDSIVYQIFQKSNLEEVELHQLEQFVNDYPYCATGQFLLAKKYHRSDNPSFSQQANKTAIYFTNPHWLNQLLFTEDIRLINGNKDEKIAVSDNNKIVSEVHPKETEIPTAETITVSQNSEAIDIAAVEDIESPNEEIQQQPDIAEANVLPEQEITEVLPAEKVDIITSEEQNVNTDDPSVNTEILTEETTTVSQNSDAIDIAAVEDIESPNEEIQQQPDLAEANVLPEQEITEVLPAEKVDIITSEEQNVNADDLSVNNETETTDEGEKKDVNISPEIEQDSNEPLISVVKLKSILDNPIQPDQNGESLIPIEPLHTVDYFASQGIKIPMEIEGQDRLSIKLRSFTDWLKTMKKIHPEKLESELDHGAQTAIQHIAEHSNEAKEVVTEAMAEVFAKQGLNNKALEVYRKLSLLNPDKRVYFAAKISKLNDL